MSATSLPRTRLSVAALVLLHAIALIVVLGYQTPAWAQQPPGPGGKPEGSTWGVGLAVMSAQEPYRGMDRKTQALPMLSYENSWLKLSGPNVELKLPSYELAGDQRINFGIVAKLFGGGGYDASDSPFLAGMADRDSSVWIGPKVEWENDVADLSLEILGDAQGNSKGRRIALGAERKWRLGPNFMLIPKIGVEWVDKKYADYYYGVRTSEARAGRAAYRGDATAIPEISLSSIYRFDPHHSMMLSLGVKSLGKEIKNSPIVDRSTENRVMLGYMYRF